MNYKKIVFFSTLFASSISFSQVAIGNLNPHPHAQLDVSGERKGILIPKITLSDVMLADPFDDTADRIPESLLVYNTDDLGIAAGYYYWSGTKWNKIAVQSDPDTGLTTNILESFENTMTSTVNDVEATAPIINTVTNTLDVATIAGYPLTTMVNGIEATTVNIPEPWNLAGGSIKATKNDENIYMNGKVGIGAPPYNNPSAWLDVKGDALINDLTVGKGKGNVNTNTAVGNQALYNNSGGYNNTATGYQALFNNTRGYNNTANGYQALFNNTEGYYNVANGHQALFNNTRGYSNTANGYQTLFNNTEGYYNVANGRQALSKNTLGKYNTASGYLALMENTEGEYNTAIGYNSGPASGSINLTNTTAIGYNTRVNTSNTIRLGNDSITHIFAAVNVISSSDRRWKENIETIPLGLDFINKVRPVEYIRKNNENKTKEWGVIAQELQQTIENTGYQDAGVVQSDNTPDNYLSVRYTDLIAPMIKAIQELSLQNEALKRQNDQIRMENDQKISALENEINEMKKRIH